MSQQQPRPAMAGIRAAIIDLDGTMVHTAPDFQVAINRMRDELGLPPLSIETVMTVRPADSASFTALMVACRSKD